MQAIADFLTKKVPVFLALAAALAADLALALAGVSSFLAGLAAALGG